MTITTATTAAEDTTSDASRIANVEQFAYRMRHNVIDMGEEQGQGYVGRRSEPPTSSPPSTPTN